MQNTATQEVSNTAQTTQVAKPEHNVHTEFGTGFWVPLGLAVFFFLAFFLGQTWINKQLSKIFKGSKKGVNIYKNTFWISCWVILILLLFLSLIFSGLFYHEIQAAPLFYSKIDGLILLVSGTGVIGAVWAILARIDAEKAFSKSQETLNALGNTFNFSEILNKDKLPDIIDTIGKSNTKINLFLGFPCVGFLYKKKNRLPVKPNRLLNTLNSKLNEVVSNIEDLKNFHLSIAYFSQADSISLLTETSASGEKKYNAVRLNDKNPTTNDDLILAFYRRIDSLKTLDKTILEANNSSVTPMEIPMTENLRFVSVHEDGRRLHENKAIVWIVPDLGAQRNEFDSAAFQSSDVKLITVLESVFPR